MLWMIPCKQTPIRHTFWLERKETKRILLTTKRNCEQTRRDSKYFSHPDGRDGEAMPSAVSDDAEALDYSGHIERNSAESS